MLLEVVQRHMGSESLLQAADSTASAEGQTPASWELVMCRWNQGCACLAQCSVSLGNSHRQGQSHSPVDWELLAEEKSPTALLFLVGTHGDRPPSLSLWSPVKIPVPQAAVTIERGCACAEAPHSCRVLQKGWRSSYSQWLFACSWIMHMVASNVHKRLKNAEKTAQTIVYLFSKKEKKETLSVENINS